MFKVGQKVVYPNHGVTVVEDIATSLIDGTERTCYHLRLLSSNSKVMVPKDNLDLVGLRPLCDAKDIKAVLGILESGTFDAQKDWKGRYKQNVEKMKTGRITEVAEVLRNLKFVSQKKSLSFREKKMYERAKHFIVSEVAHVKGLTERDAEQQVEKALTSSMAKRARATN
ncbi:MAG TPA: CarD family transcriptional regulator [Thermoanaerobaculia bacterium]|nr:CarD family transcriptional regulator [Thermoanaerobaculia bacterium]